MGFQFKMNMLISFDSSVVWSCLSCTIKITRRGWLMGGGGAVEHPLPPFHSSSLSCYLSFFVLNSPELCEDLRGEGSSWCILKLVGLPQAQQDEWCRRLWAHVIPLISLQRTFARNGEIYILFQLTNTVSLSKLGLWRQARSHLDAMNFSQL